LLQDITGAKKRGEPDNPSARGKPGCNWKMELAAAAAAATTATKFFFHWSSF